MKKMLPFLLSLSFLFFALAASAEAALFSQPVNTNLSGKYSNQGSYQQEADDFILGLDSWISDLHWWGGYASTVEDDDFLIRFFEDDGGNPTAAPFAQVPVDITRTDTGVNFPTGEDVYYYEADLSSSVFAKGGDTYYLSIINNLPANWFWGENELGTKWSRIGESIAWTKYDSVAFNFAFELTGEPIPEPSTILLITTGLFGLVRLRKKFRKI